MPKTSFSTQPPPPHALNSIQLTFSVKPNPDPPFLLLPQKPVVVVVWVGGWVAERKTEAPESGVGSGGKG